MKNKKIYFIIGGLLIVGIVGYFTIKKVAKTIKENQYGKNADTEDIPLTDERAQILAKNLLGAMQGWTSSQDEIDILNWLDEAKTKADLELIIDKFKDLKQDGLVHWLKEEVDIERARRKFDSLGVTF